MVAPAGVDALTHLRYGELNRGERLRPCARGQAETGSGGPDSVRHLCPGKVRQLGKIPEAKTDSRQSDVEA